MWDVVICEDFDNLRESLAEYLQESGQWTVRAVRDGQALRGQFIERVPDLLLVDVGLPGESGIELTLWVRSAYPSVGVVMLSGRYSASDRLAGWRSGTDVYLVKPVEMEEVELALKAVVARAAPSGEAARRESGPRLMLASRCLEGGNGQRVGLTSRELMVLQMLAQSPGVIVESEALRAMLWRDEEEADYQNALFSLVRRLRRKVETVGVQADAIVMVRGRGYRFSQAPSLRIVLD